MLPYNKLFIFFGFSFLFGIFINNYYLDYKISLYILFFIIFICFNYYLYIKKFLIFILIIFIGFLLGIYISSNNSKNINKNYNLLNTYLNEKYNITFQIEKISKINDHDIEYLAKVNSIENIIINSNIKSIIIISKKNDIKKGLIIKSKVKLYFFKNKNSFSYKEYLLSKNIFFKSYINKFEIIKDSGKKQNKILKIIDNIKNSFLLTIKKIYPINEGIFLQGILLGAKENLPNDLKTNFNNSGLTHFIAVSGFNITIIIIFVTIITKYLPNFFKIIFVTILISFFTILVGAETPVIRASIMGLIGYYIIISGRKGNSLSIILLTAIMMTIYSPYSLNYDISFHLSFLAVIGIVYTQDFLNKIFNFLPDFLYIKESFILTLSALSFTLPIIFFNFGQISILSPIANIAVAWTIPIAMLIGFVSIISFYLYSYIGIGFGYITWILLKFDILMVNFFGSLDFAIIKIDFGIYKNYLTLLYFSILIFMIMYHKSEKKEL